MNQLSTFLVESILNEEIKDLVVIYSGRFQPFHKGHFGVYDHLVKKFGKNDVYIGTSDKTEPKRSPLTFKEKQELMNRMFKVPKSQIVQIKNPYAPTEILKKYNPDTTAYVTVVGEKDAGRLSGKYFKPFPKDGNLTTGYKERGYVYVAPTMAKGISGTQVRAAFSKDTDEPQQIDVFNQLYPKFDRKIFNLLTQRLSESSNPIFISKEIIERWCNERFPEFVNEISTGLSPDGSTNADDGPIAFFPNFDVYDDINKARAERIGYTVVKQIMNQKYEDYYDHPIYPDGPIDATSSFPAGVIGKLTAMNQRDFDTVEAYDDWFQHVTRKMALAGYELINFSLTGDFGTDEEDRDLSVSGLDTLKDDPTAPSSRGISESTQHLISEEDINRIVDEAIEEFSAHMGYPSKEQYNKKLQTKLDKMKQGDDEYKPIAEAKKPANVEYDSPFRLNNDNKKFGVYVKNPDTGNDLLVKFGDPNMKIKRDNDKARKAFRSRHNCDDKTDKTTPGYWSCKMWQSGTSVSDLLESDTNQVECPKCDHSWNIEGYDPNPHFCHNCGWDHEENKYRMEDLERWKVQQKLKESYDKTLFYLQYFKDLAPSGMNIERSNGNIIIDINNQLSEQIINIPDSLGIVRHKMPQIAANDIDNFIQWVKSEGVNVREIQVPVKDIKMTQKEIESEKVEKMMGDEIDSLKNIVIISNDLHLLDGHHRVVAIYNLDDSISMKALQIDLSIDELLELTSKYPKTFYKSVDEQIIQEVVLAESTLKLQIPVDIRKIHKLFKRNKKKLYIVGGAVRDAILGKSPKDFDLATDAKPDEVIRIAKQSGLDVVEVGKSFGVVVVGGHEIATFRKDIGQGRRPDSVEYTDIEGDVRRRDLTINALFYDLDKESIVDLVGGIEDLQKKRVRTVGDPNERFDEDPLRKLRAIRFAAQIGKGSLEGDTYNALRSNPSLQGVSVERIRDEFIKGIQKAKSISQYLKLADDVGLLPQIFPSVKITKPFIDENNVEVLLSYLLQSNNTDKLIKYLNKKGYSVEEIRNIKFLLYLAEFNLDNIVSLKRLHNQVSITDNDILRFGKYINKNFNKFVNFELKISGQELMDKGYKGKKIGNQMNKLEKQRYLNEDIKIPIKIGDTILTGRFKNKKTIVKDIGEDEHGMPTINGRKVVTFRIPKDEQLTEVVLGEAPIKIRKGHKFVAQNSFQDIEKGAQYIVNAVKGTIGDLRILVTRLGTRGGKTDHKEINVRSVPEFYKYIMMENVVNESKYSYGCFMLDVPFVGWNKVTSTIDHEDIYEPEEGGFGIENKPHITILYGLHDDVIIDEIVELTADIEKVDYIIKGVSIFENENFDVVKFEIESDHLRQLRDRAIKLPHTTTYPEYNPHMTIAYVKPGAGKKYAKAFNRPILKTSNEFMYSTSDKTKYKWVAGETDNPHQVLSEGGAYGHMAHPFDQEIDLTFGDLKNIVNLAFEGELDTTIEKTDGQALAISWRDGKLVAARNKGHLKNKGERALDINGIRMKFDGRGELSKAYNYAMRDLQNAISKLSDKQKEFIFKGGSAFMNLEVIYPENANVIQYGQPLLIFHGTMEFDMDGKAIGENKEAARILAGMIKQVNQNVQKTYAIQGPPVVELPKRQNLSRLKGPFLRKINQLQSEFNLKDNHGVNEYHVAWWTQWIDKNAPSKPSPSVMKGLVKRWALNDKSFRLNSKEFEDAQLLEWAKAVDKQDHKKIQKTNLRKFEDVFLSIGAEILSFVSSALVVNPDSALRGMKNRLDQSIKDIEKGGSEDQIKKLRQNLERLEAIGGVDKIVPIEGIVFSYKGQTLKLTGSFASLNQILGIMYY